MHDKVTARKVLHMRCSHLTIRAGRKTTGALRTFSCYAIVNIFIRAKLEIAYDF